MTKRIFSIFSILLLTFSVLHAQVKKKIPIYELDVIRGQFYQPNTMGPYNGVAYEVHPKGKKKLEAPIKDGRLHGTVKEWARNGQKVFETKYENGVQVDKEMQWYANGAKKLEVAYLNGKPNGMCLEWHQNGKKKSEGLFKNGLEEGEHNWWYDWDEPEQKTTYKNGLQEGLSQNWYRSGQIKLEAPYQSGKREGTVKEYFENGQIKMQGLFANDLEDKEHLFWSKQGFLLGKQIFDKGSLKKEYNYRSGSIKTSNGSIQVFNQKESFYRVDVTGDRVVEINDPANIVYAVDGMLLQMYDIPLSSFKHSTDSILEDFVQHEKNFIQEGLNRDSIDFTIKVSSKMGKTKSGIAYVHWQFPSPSSQNEEQKPRTPQVEHYLSLLCNQQILNLYSVVTNSDEPQQVEAMLNRIANQIQVEKERIDLNEIAKTIK